MTMSKAEQTQLDDALAAVESLTTIRNGLEAELAAVKAEAATQDETIRTQAGSVARLLEENENLRGQLASRELHEGRALRAEERANTLDAENVRLRTELETFKAKARADAASPPVAPITKVPVGRISGEHGLVILGDTHAFDTIYRAGDVMSEYAIDFYGPAEEAAYLARRTGMAVTPLADGTPRVTCPSKPQADAIADGARKLVSQDGLATKIECRAVRSTGLQARDATRVSGAGLVEGRFVGIQAPSGLAVYKVGPRSYLLEG